MSSANRANAIALRHAMAFSAVAHYGSFTRASEALHLSQPALTARIQQLETIVGVPLLERTTRTVRLTTAGEEFLRTSQHLIESFALASQEVEAIARGHQGQLAIAAIPTVASSLLPGPLHDFARERPLISIQLITAESASIRTFVAEGKVELGLVGVTAASEALVSSALGEDRIGLVCRADHPLAGRGPAPIRWADLEGSDIRNMGYEGRLREAMEAVPSIAKSYSLARYRVTSPAALAAIVEATNALTILPELAVPLEYRHRIAFVPVTGPEVSRSISVVWRRGHALSQPAEAMLLILNARRGDWLGLRSE